MRNAIYLLLLLTANPLFGEAPGNVSHNAAGGARELLFFEPFEDTLFVDRGWYDALEGTITSEEHIEGSTACFECLFLQGAAGDINPVRDDSRYLAMLDRMNLAEG